MNLVPAHNEKFSAAASGASQHRLTASMPMASKPRVGAIDHYKKAAVAGAMAVGLSLSAPANAAAPTATPWPVTADQASAPLPPLPKNHVVFFGNYATPMKKPKARNVKPYNDELLPGKKLNASKTKDRRYFDKTFDVDRCTRA